MGEANLLIKAIKSSRRKILVFLFFVINLVIILGSIMYLVEGESSGFDSIPRSIYWAIVTLTTVGYGDIAPQTPLGQFFASGRSGAISSFTIIFLIVVVIAVIGFVVFVERALRKVPLQYPRRQVGMKIFEGENSNLPVKVNPSGVIPAIFASALLLLPITISNFGFADSDTFLKISSMFTQGQPLYMLLYASGIIFFTFFYTSITFNPNETAENLRKYGGFIPGIRPGESTALYILSLIHI